MIQRNMKKQRRKTKKERTRKIECQKRQVTLGKIKREKEN